MGPIRPTPSGSPGWATWSRSPDLPTRLYAGRIPGSLAAAGPRPRRDSVPGRPLLNVMIYQPPQADGLYDPRFEHDACGVAFVANLDNVPSHDVVVQALQALENLEHRGAEGATSRPATAPGSCPQMPDAFFRAVATSSCPSPAATASRSASSPHDDDAAPQARGAARAERPRRGPARPRLARRADRRGARRRHGAAARGRSSASCSSARARASTTTRTPSSASST